MVMIHSPREASKPASTAACCPKFRAKDRTRNSGRAFLFGPQQGQRSIGRAVINDDHLERLCGLFQHSRKRRSNSGRTLSASLSMGTTTDTCGLRESRMCCSLVLPRETGPELRQAGADEAGHYRAQ